MIDTVVLAGISKELRVSTKGRLNAHKSLALETHDNSLLRIINFALDKIRSFETSRGCHYQATEQEVQGILSDEVKSLRKSAAAYRAAADSAQDEESRRKFETLYFDKLSEAGILSRYLQQRASEAEMFAAVQHATCQVKKAGVPQVKQPGIIYKLARKNLSNRAFDDGRLVEMVKSGY